MQKYTKYVKICKNHPRHLHKFLLHAPTAQLPIYLISKMHTKTIQKIQKAYIKTYEEDVKIYKDIENSQGQGLFFENTGLVRRLYFHLAFG